MNVPYIDYMGIPEFCTIGEVCQLFRCEKAGLKQACEKYDVTPIQNEIGEYGFSRYDVRKLHNALYHASKDREKEADPWA